MKYPSKKTILGRDIKYEFSTLEDHDGCYDPHNFVIKINNELSKKGLEKQLLATILHEEGHALLDLLGFNQTSLSLDMQELIVENYANFLVEHYKLLPRK